MTDAHAKAVEAAVARFALEYCRSANEVTPWPEIQRQAVYFAVQDYLAAMRAEGWVMVRDVGKDNTPDAASDYNRGERDGWNACRAIMLGGAGDGQG